MRDDESLSAYLTKIFDLINQMRSCRMDLARSRIVQKLLISLPSAYDSIYSVIEHSKDLDVIEVQEVVAFLKSFELRLDRHSGDKTEKAFASVSVNPKLEKYSGSQSGSKDQKNWKAKGKKWDNKSTDGARNRCKLCGKLHFGNLVVDTKMGRRYVKEVLLVVGLKENLLSVGKMMEHGYVLIFGANKVALRANVKSSTLVWHRRMGHLNFTSLKLLQDQEMVLGLPEIKLVNEVCEGCTFGKHCRDSFPKETTSRATIPLELIHTDVCGPMQTVTEAGNRYFLTFIDDCTHMGMERQLTVAYSPQQNGVAERKNRTIMEMAKCMMIEKKMPLEFWAEAVNTAVDVIFNEAAVWDWNAQKECDISIPLNETLTKREEESSDSSLIQEEISEEGHVDPDSGSQDVDHTPLKYKSIA
ncbi:hypothetical protein L3X38_023625 [Prunus dulcis]|uniref:Integrase catalytic domain-containing protein n=1 Tax=Prunus dulcis TaxID=3755 RepID=A0AAD4VY67_PRUDU|nr:hypothetical protein L3X38_023625 [Prunus dulcis]